MKEGGMGKDKWLVLAAVSTVCVLKQETLISG